jgi:cobalt/nickel transport system ATP-binding protein
MTVALEFRAVTVRYPSDAAATLTNLSFTIAAGERVALMGLNGSGKTTLLMATVGLVAHEGEIHIAGERLTPRSLRRLRDQVGFVFNVPEDQLLFPKVIDDIAFGLLRRGLPHPEVIARARQTAAELGLAGQTESPLHHLSHGQKQRVALAGALVADPALLLLDEPSAGLDPPGKRALAAVLGHRQAAIITATHDLDFAARLCTRFVLLDQGRFVLDTTNLAEIERRWDL